MPLFCRRPSPLHGISCQSTVLATATRRREINSISRITKQPSIQNAAPLEMSFPRGLLFCFLPPPFQLVGPAPSPWTRERPDDKKSYFIAANLFAQRTLQTISVPQEKPQPGGVKNEVKNEAAGQFNYYYYSPWIHRYNLRQQQPQ